MVVLGPEQSPGATPLFSDPDGHLWVVTNAQPW